MRVTVQTQHLPDFVLVDATHLNVSRNGGEMVVLRDLEGWFESVEPRVENQPDLPGLDGMFWPEETFLTGRVLTVRGTHIADGPASTLSVSLFRDRLASLSGQRVALVVSDSSGDREVTGFVAAAVRVNHRSELVTDFTLIISCPDPLKYGASVDYSAGGGAVTVENVGTGLVAPIVSATARVRSIQVDYGGQTVKWLGDSVGLVLDLADGRPLNSNGVETGVMVWADPIRIPTGSHQLTVAADVPVTVSVRSGWK